MLLEKYKQKGKTFIIAEIGQAHDGSLGILHSFIDAASEIGIDAIKFQVHIANAESSLFEPFRVKFSYEDNTRFDYWKRMELTENQWKEVKKKCDDLGIEFLATPFSNTAIDLLEKLDVKRYKVGSGDASNLLLLEKILTTKKEVIISTGLSTPSELDKTIEIFKNKKIPFTILQCTTKYPTLPIDLNLKNILNLENKYNCPVGLSDHSGTIYPGLGAITIGASIVEAHITFDKKMFGPDAKASLTIKQFKKLVEGIRFLEIAKENKEKKSYSNEKNELRRMFGRAIAVNKNLSKGHIIKFEDLEVKKPSDSGIPVNDFKNILGKKLIIKKSAWDFKL